MIKLGCSENSWLVQQCLLATLGSLQILLHLSFRPNRHYHPPFLPAVPGRIGDSHRVREDGVKGMTSVPPPGRSPIVWKMANGTTMPAARSSRLRVSTHSTAGRCRQETHKSPSTRWNHSLVTRGRDRARVTSIVSVPL